MSEQKAKIEPLVVNMNTYVGSTYSQVVGVTVTDIDLTLEFVYINPRDKTKGQIVARITLPRSAGEELAKIITGTITQHEKNKKGGKK